MRAVSLPGTACQPVLACHSQTAPMGLLPAPPPALAASDEVPGVPGRGPPVLGMLVAATPPSGNPTTALKTPFSGATTHPTHVTEGGLNAPSSSNTSIDSRAPWCTT